EVDVGGREARAANGFARRLRGKVRGRDPCIDDVPLADAGALQNPFVGGFDETFEIGVGEQPWRHVGGQARNARAANRTRGRIDYHSPESLPGAVSPKYS